MGRTLATYRQLLEDEIARWSSYRRALRKGDQEVFDELMNYARRHSSASSYQAPVNIFETMVLSMLLELRKELDKIQKS
jgi:hypothetical protein